MKLIKKGLPLMLALSMVFTLSISANATEFLLNNAQTKNADVGVSATIRGEVWHYHTGFDAFCQPRAAQSGTAHFFHILGAKMAANILRAVFESIDIHGFLLPGIKNIGQA